MMTTRRIVRRSLEGLKDELPDDLNPVLRRVLLARGVTRPEQLQLQLPRLARPDALGGIDRAAALLQQAIEQNRQIVVVGDFDADGATGSAVAVRGLTMLGARRVRTAVPDRFRLGYGLSAGLVREIADDPETADDPLLVTVDNGISSITGVAAAKAAGWQVLVTDHHLPGERLPAADAIVNPNLPGDPFPSKNLAGVGVMFYLLLALRQRLRQAGVFEGGGAPRLDRLLDLVALGTVADLVSLDGNNRILVAQGLQRIRAGHCQPGVRALLEVSGRNPSRCEAADLAFAVAPRLNAAGRLEDMAVGIECLTTDDPDHAETLARRLHELNHQRRDLQARMQDDAMAQIQELLTDLRRRPPPMGLCLFQEDWHQGVVGLVASRVKDALHRPVVAFAPEAEGADLLKGSGRSVAGIHIRDALAMVDALHPDMIQRFGGHAMAAGLTLERRHLPVFRQAFEQAVTRLADGDPLENELRSDGPLRPEELHLDTARALRDGGPWGQRFPEPLFDGEFEIVDRRVVGERHLKLILAPPGGEPVLDAIAFNTRPDALPEGKDRSRVRLVYRLQVNWFRGENCQLVVEHIEG